MGAFAGSSKRRTSCIIGGNWYNIDALDTKCQCLYLFYFKYEKFDRSNLSCIIQQYKGAMLKQQKNAADFTSEGIIIHIQKL